MKKFKNKDFEAALEKIYETLPSQEERLQNLTLAIHKKYGTKKANELINKINSLLS